MTTSKLRVGIGLIVILALAAAGLSGVLAADDTKAATEPAEKDVRYAMSFRANFAFQSDEPFVRGTFDDPDGFPGSDWGLPLSPSEAADLDERGRIRPLIQPAIEYALSKPDSGGMWFDQRQGGKALFRFTDDLAAHEAELAGLMPSGADWEVVLAEYSTAQLRSLQETITTDFAELVAAGIPVTQIVASARLNAVLVGLEEEQPEAETELRSRYGPAVSTELIGLTQDDACNRRDDCRPLMGGLKIRPQGSSAYFCSSAFQAEKNGVRMLVTAGHCVQDWGSGHVWENGADRFGTAANHTLPPPGTVSNPVNADADLGWIKTDAFESITPANTFIRTDEEDIKSFDHIATNNMQQEGDPVCRSGATTKWMCGLIINTAANKPNGEGHMISNVWVMNKDAEGGDSGGIVVERYEAPPHGEFAYRAAGVHVHSGNDQTCLSDPTKCRAWYSTAQDLEDLTQLVICRSSGC
jgi:hypothetical protein